jgi:hypothetical protein
MPDSSLDRRSVALGVFLEGIHQQNIGCWLAEEGICAVQPTAVRRSSVTAETRAFRTAAGLFRFTD